MRIIAGKYRGRVINPPKGLPVRPTTDQAREGLFNILTHSVGLEDIRVLDLFAGTGMVSLEFHSRGAAHVTSVDKHRKCVAFMDRCRKDFQIRDWDIQQGDTLGYLRHTIERFDLIFMDPPYDMPEKELLVQTIFNRDLLREDGQVILEHRSSEAFDYHPNFEQQRSYGTSTFSFFSHLS